MINDPDQRAEFEADVAAVAEALPALDPALRKVMAGFFELVGHQIDEVERIQQRCAQRVKRFTAFGTMEQSRGVARQLNEAIGAARALPTPAAPTHPPWARWPRRRVTREWSAARRRRMLPYSRPSPTRWPSGHVVRRDLPAGSLNVNAAMMKPATRSRRRSRTAVAVSMCCFAIVPCPNHRF